MRCSPTQAPAELRAGRLLLRITLALASAVAVLGLFEWAASTQVDLPADQLARSARLHHVWEPHYQGDSRDRVPFSVRVNAQGWREEHDVARRKPPTTFRIFYVGDSFTEGFCEVEDSRHRFDGDRPHRGGGPLRAGGDRGERVLSPRRAALAGPLR